MRADVGADQVAPQPPASCWAGCIDTLHICCCCLGTAAVHPEAQQQVSTLRSHAFQSRWDADTEMVGLTSEPGCVAAGTAVVQRTKSLVIGGAPLQQQLVRSSSSPPERQCWNSVRDDVFGLVRVSWDSCDAACSMTRGCKHVMCA